MAFSLGGLGGFATGALWSWLTWLLLFIAIVVVSFGGLWMRKKGKMRYPGVIIQDLGNGKVNLLKTKCGWFKSKKILGGLIDYAGERRLEVKDGRFIQQGKTADFHELNYKTAIILLEKSDDPKVLVPIDRMKLDDESQKILLRIAPGDYRDSASKIIADAEKETQSNWMQVAQLMVFAFVGIVLFISIILVIQYAKNTMADANRVYDEAIKYKMQTCSTVNAEPSSSAP